jgi:hypothetical protein
LPAGPAEDASTKRTIGSANVCVYFDQNGDVQTFTERVTEYLSVTRRARRDERAVALDGRWLAGQRAFRDRYGEEVALLALAPS